MKEKYATDFPPQRAGARKAFQGWRTLRLALLPLANEALEVMNEDNVENEDGYNAELAKHNKRAAQHEEDVIKDRAFAF